MFIYVWISSSAYPMNGISGSKRVTKLVNLGGVDDDMSTSPVDVPERTNHRFPGIQSAPGIGFVNGSSRSLLEPVIDEGDVISSSYKSDSSTMERRREAASGGLGAYTGIQGGYGSVNGALGPRGAPPELEHSHEIEDDYEKIAMRHKRAEHATRCVHIIIKSSFRE